MKRMVVASTRRAAGKTSMIVGIAGNLGSRVGYMKPFGDRPLYRKKRLWDYDAALMTALLGLEVNPEDISIGMDHSKLWYMYDREGTARKLDEMVGRVGEGRDVVLVEGGAGLSYGTSVNLDPVSLARQLDAELLLVAGGNTESILDDLTFVHRHLDLEGVRPPYVVVNKVQDESDLTTVHLEGLSSMGFRFLGTVPLVEDLGRFTVSYLSHVLFAKLLAGEDCLSREVSKVYVGAMSAQAALADPRFSEEAKLIITSGDRTDMVRAAIESGAAAVILTNNIPPPAFVISSAEDRGVPLLLVPQDTYQTARRIDALEPLITAEDAGRIGQLERLVRENLDLEAFEGTEARE